MNTDWYKAIIRSSPDGFLLIKHPGGDIIDVNDTICNVLGYSRDELLSMKIKDIEVGFDESLDSIRSRIADIEENREASFEARHRRKDGKIIDVAVSLRYLEEGLSFCFHRDITEQKKKEKKERRNLRRTKEALKETEDRYRTLMELDTKIGEAVIMLQDIDGREGVHTYVSDQWSLITGYSREELLGRSFFEFVVAKDAEALVKRHQQKMSVKIVPELFETSIVNKRGEEVPIELTSATTSYKGKPIRVVYIRDITERKQAQNTILESEKLYRGMFQNVPVAIVENDFSQVKNIYNQLHINGIRDFEKYFLNCTQDEIFNLGTNVKVVRLNQQALDLWEVTNIQEYMNHSLTTRAYKTSTGIRQSHTKLAEGLSHFDYEEIIETMKGNLKYLHIWVSVAPGYEDSLSRVYLCFADVTTQKETENKLREYQYTLKEKINERTSRLISANKQLKEQNNQRTQFTRALVHELKTPLTTILGASEILLLNLPESVNKRLASNLYHSAQQLNTRVIELMDLARSEIGILKLKTEPSNLGKLVQKVTNGFSSILESRSATLINEVDSALPDVTIDTERIEQVIQNLINNALFHTRTGVEIKIYANRLNNHIQIDVTDNGPGIGKEVQKHLFKMYYKSNMETENLSGLGIGLAFCKILVELHGGKIWVSSIPGTGSTFSFTIPLT